MIPSQEQAGLQDELAARLDEIARTPNLLVASDFDGTLAPIVADPASAEGDRDALVALKALAAMPHTHVAIISGRSLHDLAQRLRQVEHAHLVGSHGSEFEAGFAQRFAPDTLELYDRLAGALREITAALDGASLEEKPASLAFHYRNTDPAAAQQAVDEILSGPASWPGVYARHGKKVLELSVVETNKGAALRRIRSQVGASAVLFVGDDLTDEDAFLTLSGPDAGVKVGPGPTAAALHVTDTLEVARMLAHLAECRAEWIAGAQATPIEQHSVLSDQRTLALVNPSGRVVWMCLPRIDSASVFSELLGGPSAGFFEISPATGEPPLGQSNLDRSLVLETKWPTMRVIDYLDCGGGRAFQRAGRTDLVRAIEGTGRARVVFAPRLDFGRMETRLSLVEEGVIVEGSVESFVLRAPDVRWRIQEDGRNQVAIGECDLDQGPVTLELRFGTANLEPNPIAEPQRRERTRQFWSSWTSTLTLPKLARDQVLTSALVLKALCYGPTGAIVAAGTTSLPEFIGGVRNWDYRFCWPRDASMSATALLRLGASGPGIRLLDWALGILDYAEPGALISPIYTVTGSPLGPEGEIAELAGYRGSRPVRIGNAAARQVQLDVFGPIAELVALLAHSGAALSSEHWRLVDTMCAAVERHWHEPDHGIWEERRTRLHHVHSKVMCWQTIDRALQVAKYLGRRRPDWVELRDRIAEDVLTRGWHERRQAFCGTYEECEPDAATLSVGLSGLLPATDPRFLSTVEFVERSLRDGPTVYRYRYDDGLPGSEGGFNLCTTWLIEAYALVGRRDDALELFDAYLRQAGPTGLMAEEFDPASGIALGNFPQAYSHLGLINAALCLEATEMDPKKSYAM